MPWNIPRVTCIFSVYTRVFAWHKCSYTCIIIFIFNLQTDVSYPFVPQDPALMNQHTNAAFQTDEQHGYFTLDSREPG